MSDCHSSRRRRKKKATRDELPTTVDQKDHDDVQDQIFQIKTSPRMGRFIVSRKNLQPGEEILSEEPLVLGPCTGARLQCLGCYKPLETFIKCTNCGWPMCSPKCPGLSHKFGHTDQECQVLKSASPCLKDDEDINLTIKYYNAIVPLRCLLLKTTHPEVYQQFLKMESHCQIRRKIIDLWKNNQELVVDPILNDWGLKDRFTESEVHFICGVLEVNCFEIGQSGVNIRGLYPTAFLLCHDCVPNTSHTDDENFKLTIRASTKINVGQPITLSYAYTLQSTLKRREHLLDNKFFECQCRRCSDPSELGTYMGALICPKCQKGRVLATDPLKNDSDWRCIDCHNYTIKFRSMQLLIDRIGSEIDSVDSNDVEAFEQILEKFRNVLHPSHYLNLGVKMSLSQLYGKIPGYLIHELDDKTLERKEAICREILRVFDVVEPGFTRLRGVTLYEMHAPIMIVIGRKFGDWSKRDLRTNLKRVVKLLEEADAILRNEPRSSAEGIMGVAARDALMKIREWEGILGKF